MDQLHNQVNALERQQINEKLNQGISLRASTLLFVWSFIAVIYGFMSMDLFRSRLPDLDVWSNIWPRLLFNTIPAILVAKWYSDYKKRPTFKAYSTIIVLPVLMLAASMIHAWPIFFGGDYDFYLYFHATNIIAMASGLALISATPQIVLLQAMAFLVIYFGPLIYFFGTVKFDLAKLIVSDVALISVILMIGLRGIYQLRLKLATEDVVRKKKAAPFLGESLAKALYESKSMEVTGYTQTGIIMAVDLRGYTTFTQISDTKMVKAFMNDYHAAVTRIVSSNKGYLHKTSGDGLLISFAVMEKDEDLSDIPGIESDLQLASKERMKSACKNSVETFQQIISAFEELKEKYKVPDHLLVGAGIASGEIDVVVRGDANFRQELDIDGEPIVRAVRLEAYSKLLNKMVDQSSSFLIISPELSEPASVSTDGLKVWMTNNATLAVRDYPNIQSVAYRQWKHKRIRSTGSQAA